MQLQRVERERVAGGFGRAAEKLTHQDGCVDLHLRGDLVAQEGREDEVQLSGLAEPFDPRIAKSDALFLGFWDERDVGVGGERDAEADSANRGAELRLGVNANDDAVLHESDVGRLGIDVAGRGGVATDVVAALRAIEELGAQRALEGLGGDLDLDRGGRAGLQRTEAPGEAAGRAEVGACCFKA